MQNPWDVIQFSGNARIHLDSFLSVFNISGLPEEYYHNSMDHIIFYHQFLCTTLSSGHLTVEHSHFYLKYPDENFLSGELSSSRDTFVDGAVIAAARTLPTWSDGDVPPVPSIERKAVKELQEECQRMLAEFPTSSKEDQKLLGKIVKAFLILLLPMLFNRLLAYALTCNYNVHLHHPENNL